MPETYTGSEGTEALAAGLATMDGTEPANKLWLAINKVRDWIATRVQPIAKGGTGATTPADARAALGANNAGNLTAGTLPAARLPDHQHPISGDNGITGLSSALSDLSSYQTNRLGSSPASPQPLYNPYGRANPVATSWVAAALDSAGRLGIQPSSIRFKTVRADYDGSALELQPVLYTLNADELDEMRAGLVAEQVAEHLPHGVVLDADGRPLALQLDAIVAAVIRDVQRLAGRVAELEEGDK